VSHWAVIPAAGVGSRMGSDIPKQYLQIAGKTVLEHTLDRFIQHPFITGIVVAISENDSYWEQIRPTSEKPLITAKGGRERCDSVLSALRTLGRHADPEDWVLVHDAARPCLRADDLNRLINTVSDHPVGGLLAVPVRDTMKRSDGNHTIVKTVDRQNLWHALTPQMFRLAGLSAALEQAQISGHMVTDEAQAMEWANQHPLLVEGHIDNIKITHPQDLELAEHYLKRLCV